MKSARWSMLFAILAMVAARSAAAQSLQGQTSIVVAFVTDTAGRPVAGADVQVVGTSLRASTDDAGRVALLAVPTGKAVIRVRRLGFAELTIPISVTPGHPEARYTLHPIATDLDKVVVTASGLTPDRYAGTGRFDSFYRRMAVGNGTFLTREMIDARNAQKSEDLIRMVSGVRIRYRGTTPYIQFLRCEQVNVFINAIRSHDPWRDLSALHPLDMEAIEVYHGIATVPPEFSPRPNDCAAIVIWTRWHGDKTKAAIRK